MLKILIQILCLFRIKTFNQSISKKTKQKKFHSTIQNKLSQVTFTVRKIPAKKKETRRSSLHSLVKQDRKSNIEKYLLVKRIMML